MSLSLNLILKKIKNRFNFCNTSYLRIKLSLNWYNFDDLVDRFTLNTIQQDRPYESLEIILKRVKQSNYLDSRIITQKKTNPYNIYTRWSFTGMVEVDVGCIAPPMLVQSRSYNMGRWTFSKQSKQCEDTGRNSLRIW